MPFVSTKFKKRAAFLQKKKKKDYAWCSVDILLLSWNTLIYLLNNTNLEKKIIAWAMEKILH